MASSSSSVPNAGDTKPAGQTMKAEIKHFDVRYNKGGNKVLLEQHDKVYDGDKKLAWWELFALAEIRHYDANGKLTLTCVHVNAKPLKQLLQDVIVDFPGELTDAKSDIVIEHPAHCLFFHRQELEIEGRKLFAGNEDVLVHLDLLLQYIDDIHEDARRSHNSCIDSTFDAISYEHLWTVFKPGTIVYLRDQGQSRACKLRSYKYKDDAKPGLDLNVMYVDYNGKAFGMRRGLLHIAKYSGVQRLEKLGAFPLDFHPQRDQLTDYLITRGERFEKLAGENFVEYSGIALKKKTGEPEYERYNLTGRVMVDCETFHRMQPKDSFAFISAIKLAKYNNGADTLQDATNNASNELSDEERLIASATVRGFAFDEKRFLEFSVDNISEIKWNAGCFNKLVLDNKMKVAVKALISMHTRRAQAQENLNDGIAKGKGQGLVMVLHGPSGVGKTMTAECVAEYIKRPLYVVSSGDLGTDSTTLGAKLTQIMDLVSTWRAVLLIKEADMFLEKRNNLHDLHRNAMVSVFLHHLEYHTGIVFLTTNRITAIDDAFKSRIDFPIRYDTLGFVARRTIWIHFCTRLPKSMLNMAAGGFDRLAVLEVNGRQIKNIVKTAQSLATFAGERVTEDALDEVAAMHILFEEDLMAAGKAKAKDSDPD